MFVLKLKEAGWLLILILKKSSSSDHGRLNINNVNVIILHVGEVIKQNTA